MVELGSGAKREVKDIRLSRYAGYMIAMNGDVSKPEIAFAQAYFATQTRKVEELEQRMQELERIDARDRLRMTEKEFQDMVYTRGVDGPWIRYIRSIGDKALFGKKTEEMK